MSGGETGGFGLAMFQDSRKRKQPEQPQPAFPPPQGPGPGPFVHTSLIPQHDGPADTGEEKGEMKGEVGGAGPAPAAGQEGEAGPAPADDEQLSPDDSGDEEEEDEDVQNFLCAQFEKVNRTKNRWKINMKDGVFHINGKDLLFRRANGEWTF